MKRSFLWAVIWFMISCAVVAIWHASLTEWDDRVILIMFVFCDIISFTAWTMQSSMEHPAMKERELTMRESPVVPAVLNVGHETRQILVANQNSFDVRAEQLDTTRLFFMRLVRIMDRNDLVDKPGEWLKEERWINYFGDSRYKYAAFRDGVLVPNRLAQKSGPGNKPFVVIDPDRCRRLADGREKLPSPSR